jgi:Xaa-Pro dipeptidase
MMDEEGFKGLVIFSQVQIGLSGAVRYLSNLRFPTRKQYLVLPLTGEPVLIVSTPGQLLRARSHSWIKDVRVGGETEGMIQELVKVLKMLGLKDRMTGIVGLNNTLPHYDYQLLAAELPKAQFSDATGLLDAVRMVKSKEEIEMTQQTAEIADQCYGRLLEVLDVGKNELNVMAEVDKVLIEQGVEDMLVLSDKGRSFLGLIGHPESYTFKRGDHYIFSVEISGPSGYWTQIARPVCLGKPSSQYQRLFKAAMEALKVGVDNLIPGKQIGHLAKAVTDRVQEEGFKTGYWCGHGMGLDVGESPGLFLDSTVELKENMVITIHPHVMTLDGKAGIFLGDTFAVQKGGARNFSHSMCNFESL